MNIILSLFSRNGPGGISCAKNYPWCEELVSLLKAEGHYLTQIGVEGEEKLKVDQVLFNLSWSNLNNLLSINDTFISVDNFFPHFSAYYDKIKRGIVLWGLSDPKIFGYESNLNLLKNRSFLRPNQFLYWNDKSNKDSFVKPREVLEALKQLKKE